MVLYFALHTYNLTLCEVASLDPPKHFQVEFFFNINVHNSILKAKQKKQSNNIRENVHSGNRSASDQSKRLQCYVLRIQHWSVPSGQQRIHSSNHLVSYDDKYEDENVCVCVHVCVLALYFPDAQ